MSIVVEDSLIDTLHLSFEQTVPRSLVHKRSIENVLLTEVKRCEDDRFICGGRIPAAHRFFNHAGRTPQRDILFYTELGRQASLAISHAFMDVSREDVFIFEGSHAAMLDAAVTARGNAAGNSVIVDIRLQETERRKNNVVSRVVAEQIMCIDGESVFQGTGAWTIQPAALFHRLRRLSKTRTAPAGNTDADSTVALNTLRSFGRENAVIFVPEANPGGTEFVTGLLVDKSDPYFFDHACDHVPGMLLLEGCAQLAKAAVSAVRCVRPGRLAINEYEVNFQQFVECDTPIELTAQLGVSAEWKNEERMMMRVHISISQQNILAGTATLSVAIAN